MPFFMVNRPEDYVFDEEKETEYQGYSEEKPIGNYLHYEISAVAPFSIYSIVLNALVQRGVVPVDFDPFATLALSKVPPTPTWVDANDLIVETGIADTDYNETGVSDTNISGD